MNLYFLFALSSSKNLSLENKRRSGFVRRTHFPVILANARTRPSQAHTIFFFEELDRFSSNMRRRRRKSHPHIFTYTYSYSMLHCVYNPNDAVNEDTTFFFSEFFFPARGNANKTVKGEYSILLYVSFFFRLARDAKRKYNFVKLHIRREVNNMVSKLYEVFFCIFNTHMNIIFSHICCAEPNSFYVYI